jgi:hypothetical protein
MAYAFVANQTSDQPDTFAVPQTRILPEETSERNSIAKQIAAITRVFPHPGGPWIRVR